MPNLPDEINILGLTYKVTYVDKPSEVDIHHRESLWGQIDYWTRTIRVYNHQNPPASAWEVVFHETLHAIAEALKLKPLSDQANHEMLDVLALALVDTLARNGWMEFGGRDAAAPTP